MNQDSPLKRRSFLAATAVFCGVGGFGLSKAWQTFCGSKLPRLYSGAIDKNGKSILWSALTDGSNAVTVELESRAHEIVAVGEKAIVVIARRHGSYLQLRHSESLELIQTVTSPKGVYFCGHGAYDKNSQTLWVAEKHDGASTAGLGQYQISKGVIARVGTTEIKGGNPHQIAYREGRFWVAQGGVETSASTGKKLNLGNIDSDLIFKPHSKKKSGWGNTNIQSNPWLSLRHFDIHPTNKDVVAIGGQDYHPNQLVREAAPLFLVNGNKTQRLQLPLGVETNGYVGSVCFDSSGKYLAVSCPKSGKLLLFQDRHDANFYFVSALSAHDVCGLAAGRRKGEFYATTGTGSLLELNAVEASSRVVFASGHLSFDNHLLQT